MDEKKIAAIANDRERHFASIFFDHDEWIHHPPPILFKGGRYTADFLDLRRSIYIEVVGTRQAFAANRYKYLYLMEIRKDIVLEFRSHKGNLLNPLNLTLSSGRYGWRQTREQRYAETGIMPEGYAEREGLHEFLINLVLATNWTRMEVCQAIGVPQGYIGCLLTSAGRSLLIKKIYRDKILSFKKAWETHPEQFPARRGFATKATQEALGKKMPMKSFYCPNHPSGTYFDDVFKTRGPKKFDAPAPPPTPADEVRA